MSARLWRATALRRIAVVLVLLLGAPVAASAGPGRAAVDDPHAADPRVGAHDCALLGRVHVAAGCLRDTCVSGARPVRRSLGTELCALAGQGRYAFATPVDYRLCTALHRRWVAPVDWCASNPDRAARVVEGAAACLGQHSTYVNHRESEGEYDECLRPATVQRLRALAARHGTTLEREASRRSRTLCSSRPRHRYVDGLCVRGRPAVARGGDLLVGDSITWRGTDELGRLQPDLVIDGMPARQPDDLRGRLARYRADHGDPDGLVVELGTNRNRRYDESDLRADIGSLPADTVVMLVLPYRADRGRPPVVTASSTRFAGWMSAVAAARPRTCVADWRAVVDRRPDVLGDGVHPGPTQEEFWARWLSRSWTGCLDRAQAQRADS